MTDNKSLGIRIIGYGLSAAYGLGLAIYLILFIISSSDPQAVVRSPFYNQKFLTVEAFQRYVIFFWILYFPQFVGFLAVANLKEWGRKLVVGMNAVMILYVLYDAAVVSRAVQPLAVAALCISTAIILFFTNLEIKMKFRNITPRGVSVLIVDDDRGLIRMMRSILLSNGFDVFSAHTGEQGLRLAIQRRPRVIILDVILPKMKGREVCLRLKEHNRTKNIPVVFLTAKDSPDDIRAEMEVGGMVHLTKPLKPQELIDVIDRIVGERNL